MLNFDGSTSAFDQDPNSENAETDNNLDRKENKKNEEINQDDMDYKINDDDDVNNDENEDESELVEKLANKFIGNVLKPLNNMDMSDPKRNYFILVDGIDDLLLLSDRILDHKNNSQLHDENNTNSNVINNNSNKPKKHGKCATLTHTPILEFLNRVFLFFPHWLNLVVTSRRTTEKLTLRKYLPNLKYDRLIMDKCVNLNATTKPGFSRGGKIILSFFVVF